MKHWLAEVLNKEGGKNKQVYDEYDNEQFAGSTMVILFMIIIHAIARLSFFSGIVETIGKFLYFL